MKKKEWINGNKMKFESLHKTFNRQCGYITKGNQIGDVVLSSYVRAFNETKCNGFTNPKGHLQEYDLNWLLKDLPSFVKDWIRKNAVTRSVIGYYFFYRKNGCKIPIGYVVTDTKYNLLRKFPCGGAKEQSALDEAVKYITI